jgi:hypothetical protein
VPHPREKSDSNTPDPELDPLLNPLLAAHMGRWAEVYFANPPEKRGQAISALLGELGNVSRSKSAPMQGVNDQDQNRSADTAEAPSFFPTAGESVLTCTACAYDNSTGHTFCGMCGAPLQVPREANLAQAPEAGPIVGGSGSDRGSSPAGHSVELESEPVPYRQRVSMLAALAILLGVLGYMGWRGSEALSSAPSAGSAPSRSFAQSARSTSARQPSTDQTADARPASQIVPVPADSSPASAEQRGAVELATAEKYLNDNQGTPRDSAEAAQWLWKAVGKGNLAATIALSDLYLRGDGVAKSCDQARLLLEAAARKGAAAAAEKLSNLPAFGCE